VIRRPDHLGSRTFDILIVGGGIVGCGIARDAALRGLSVALVELEDFAWGASSRTSKLAHGGLRYLEHGEVHLVHESVRERERLLALAPHLVRPLPFLLPHTRGGGWPPLWLLRAGLWLYDRFAGATLAGRHTMLSAHEVLAREPGTAGLTLDGGAAYYDAQMDDARITLEVALDAAGAGAVVVNHAEVVRFGGGGDGALNRAAIRDRLTGRLHECSARLIINAAGPWADGVRRLAGYEGPPLLAPTRGVHLVYGEPLVRQAVITRARTDHRVFFILPWNGLTLIGTTDTPYAGDPGRATATPADVTYLLDAARAALPAARIEADRILSTFAGVRPLLAQGGGSHPSAASREHAIVEEPRGLLTVAGGKFTTFRAMAEEAVDWIQERLGRTRTDSQTRARPLPGGAPAGPVPSDPPTPALVRLYAFYGARAPLVLERARLVPDGLAPLCPHTWHLKAEVVHAVREEMAGTVGDILERRLGLRHTTPCHGGDAADLTARLAGPLLGWDAAEQSRQAEAYRIALAEG